MELSWSLYANFYEQITLAMSVQYGNTFAAQLQNGSGLRAFRNFQCVLSFERGYLDFRTKRRLGERDRHNAMEVSAAPFEERMIFDV